MKLLSIRNVTYLVAAAGMVPYLVGFAERIDRITLYLVCVVVFNAVPYAICLFLLRTRPLMALCASVLLLIVDAELYKDIIIYKGFSIPNFVYSAVVSMYAPLWKIALVLPVGCLVGLMIGRILHKNPEK